MGRHYRLEVILGALEWISPEKMHDARKEIETDDEHNFGDLLVKRNLISQFQLEIAVEVQKAFAKDDKDTCVKAITAAVANSREGVTDSYLRLSKLQFSGA